jgi:sec-independent protein translocase protein TatB
MFDLTSSKLLILGIVALIVVGPKDLPILLRTIGKYVGMIRRQANEFKSQFDDAMRESELESLKRDVENMGRDVENTMRKAETDLEREIKAVDTDIDQSIQSTAAHPAMGTDNPSLELPKTLEPVEIPIATPVKTGT